jgi:hypothetical protein
LGAVESFGEFDDGDESGLGGRSNGQGYLLAYLKYTGLNLLKFVYPL